VLVTWYDADGRTLAFFENGTSRESCHQLAIDGFGPPDGVYSYCLEVATGMDLDAAVEAVSSGSGSVPFPSAEDAAAAWGIGFVLVVGCYVIARSVGAVVNFINEK